jgi:tRNA G18 (ribose-2'-O)-methylase SpoU
MTTPESSSAAAAWDDSRMSEPSLLKYNVHTPLQGLSVSHVQKISAATALPVALMLYNLHGDMNIGMAIRSSVIFGFSDVYVIGRRRYDRRPEVGARNYIQIHREAAITPEFFAGNKLIPVFVEQGGVPLEEFSFKPFLPGKIPEGWKLVLVVGSESFGIPVSFLRACKAPIVSISQYGVLRSLNVAIAASIVMYEYMKQWRSTIAI